MYKCNMMCEHCPHDKECDHIPLEERRVKELEICGNIVAVTAILFCILMIIGFIFGR